MPVVRYDIRRSLSLGSIVSIIIVALVLIFDNEASPLFVKFRHSSNMHPFHPAIAAGAALLLGMGLGSQITLFLANRKRLNAVFRPNLGRLICTLFLALLVPISQFLALPIPFFSLYLRPSQSFFREAYQAMIGPAWLSWFWCCLPPTRPRA